MSEDNEGAGYLPTDRRSVLKTIGTAGIVAGGAGLGTVAFSGSAAAQSTVDVSATNPSTLSNDRGDLSKVTVDPTFRVEWENMDTAVAKVLVVIEGRVGEVWSPLFRSTPWLTPGPVDGVSQSKPGTTGHVELLDPLSKLMEREASDRDSTGEDPRSLPRPVEVVNELGRPDYESASGYGGGVDADSYLAGNSVGTADDATLNLDNGRLSLPAGSEPEYGESNLGEIDGSLPLVNNFPGAESGYYGAAADTDDFDVGSDGESSTNTVEVRYTFALLTLNTAEDGLGTVQYFTENDHDSVEAAVQNDPHLENVRESDVVTGNSELVMDGSDGYPSVTNNGAGSAASKVYEAYQNIEDSHPAALSSTVSFDVTVQNETATSDTSVTTNPGVQGPNYTESQEQ